MNDQEIIDRFEELEAGRILDDLDAKELEEWEELSRDPRCLADPSLELTAAALEAEFQSVDDAELPSGLLKELEETKVDFVASAEREDKVVRPSFWRKILSDNETAWAIAAVFLILFVAEQVVDESSDPPAEPAVAAVEKTTPDQARDVLLEKADDVMRSEFGGLAGYEGMSGEVVWSDEKQEGYLTLTNLPANDPESKQYQLWIVDPSRDEEPVDGGVFDIPSDARTAVIPIRNPLAINEPKAFLITLEQPGGVVVSTQDEKVALASANQS